MYLYLALEAYHAIQGKYPEKLGQLVPNIIPELPLDPWTDKPFVYKLLPKDHYLFSAFVEGRSFNQFDPANINCLGTSTQVFSSLMVETKSKKDKKEECNYL